MKFIWYLTNNKIQVDFEIEGYVNSIWPRVIGLDRCDWISLSFILHMTSNKTQANFDRSILIGCNVVLVLLIFSMIAYWTSVGSKMLQIDLGRGEGGI